MGVAMRRVITSGPAWLSDGWSGFVRNLSASRLTSESWPTGAWAPAETRDYHIGVQVTAAGIG
jgi:hypothetical protein